MISTDRARAATESARLLTLLTSVEIVCDDSCALVHAEFLQVSCTAVISFGAFRSAFNIAVVILSLMLEMSFWMSFLKFEIVALGFLVKISAMLLQEIPA
jgi:hypothetical protein